jgi:heme exporter protein C
LLSNGLGSNIGGLMLFSLFIGFVAISMVFAWLLIHRFRLAWLEEQIDVEGLDTAIAERRAEATGGVTA